MEYIASLSYGKDSMAMLHVIKEVLDLPLDRIITADVWATDTIPADLPPMVEFKDYADEEIKKRWGIEVEHVSADYHGAKATYERLFYTEIQNKNGKWANSRQKYVREKGNVGNPWIYGFPVVKGPWCNSHLKIAAIKKIGAMTNENMQYIGIASDEPLRIERHEQRQNISMPLVNAEWTEKMCFDWCKVNNLLSPTYQTSARGGCWFCHNQGINQLRLLRKQYPELWAILLKWDIDSVITFHPDGRTVHDIERRFRWEDEGYQPMQKQFRWADVENPQMNIFQFMEDTE